jgi:hypothetical protein
MLCESCMGRFQQIGFPPVVGVQADEPLPTGGAETGVPGSRDAAICLMEYPEAGVLRGEFVT